jgi:DNA-binding transcriptional regulator YdaS (Cro superfamily)
MTVYPMAKMAIGQRFGTQKDFAEKLGIKENCVSQILTGRKVLPPKEQSRWAQYLNVKREVLFPDQAKAAQNG